MPRIDTVFLDRDGTVIVEKHYLHDPEEVKLISGAIQGLRALTRAGMRLFLVSNQSGIGRGIFPESSCQACQARLADLLAAEGLRFEAMRYCPHAPEAGCACRKPATGMWEELRRTLDLNPRSTAMIGDKREDLGFGQRAGFAATVLLRTGHGQEHARLLGLPDLPERGPGVQELPPGRPDWPTAQARDLLAASAWLLDYSARP